MGGWLALCLLGVLLGFCFNAVFGFVSVGIDCTLLWF